MVFRSALTPCLLLGLFASAAPSPGQTAGPQTKSAPKIIFTENNPDIFELDPFGGLSFFSGVNQTAFTEKLVNGGIAGDRAAYNFSQHFFMEASYSFSVNNARLTVPGNFSGFSE